MNEDEFVDEADALADRIARLHGEDRIAAACRGSANPVALQWLAETLQLSADHVVADLGAGLGGPAAWLRSLVGCQVIAADPSPAAAAGAAALFGVPAVQATAASSPLASGCSDAVLLLGVLSVVDDRSAVVREARRVARAVGVLDYCAAGSQTVRAGGSCFPPVDTLTAELGAVWAEVIVRGADEPAPEAWRRAADRAHAGLPTPDSEQEVVDAIERGRLVPYALVGR